MFLRKDFALHGRLLTLAVASGHAAQFIAITNILKMEIISLPLLICTEKSQPIQSFFQKFGIEARFAKDDNQKISKR